MKMSMLLYLLSLTLLITNFAFAKQYTCQKCVTEKANCVGTDKATNCDYCVKIDGTVYDANLVPLMATMYLNQNDPNFKVRNGQHIFGRGCMSKQLLEQLGFDDAADCTKIEKSDNTGFIGDACTCLGNC